MHRWQPGVSATVCAAYGGVAAYLLFSHGVPDYVWPLTLAGAVAGLALSRFPLGRDLLKGVAALECVVAILSWRIFVRSLRGGLFPDLAYYVAFGVTLPALVVAFAGFSKPKPIEDELPAAYEYLARATAPMPAWQKLGMVLVLSALMFAPILSMFLFWSVLALPVGFAAYYVVQIIRTRNTPTPTVARRVVIPSQRERPAQPHSHWTVNFDHRDDRRE